MIVAGVMSGTSADGINVALVRLRGRGFATEFKLLAHYEFPYPPAVRRTILEVMNAEHASVARLSRLNFLLGEVYADAVVRARQRARVKLDLIGCHGQTIYHQGERAPFLGTKVSATWQTGEAAVIAGRAKVPVVSDFRPADMAAGGKGAPLVPFLDYVVYRNSRVGRIAQNLGGIGNLTAIPAGASADRVVAFDTGPANMVIDAACERLISRGFDRNGAMASRGSVLPGLLKVALEHPFFRRKPPKTAGREEFGREFTADFIRAAGRAKPEDIIASATALTARSIGVALRRFVLAEDAVGGGRQRRASAYTDYIVAGGGTKNPTLMRMIRDEVQPLGLRVRMSDEFGVPSQAKEAIAFAVLAYETWHHRPSNIPSATGARRPAILGKISYA
jgi:anhydro-N-acetylmuramic acid kinase